MKFFLTACLIALSLPALGNDFDNWYFNFLAGQVESQGDMFSPDGEQVGTFAGQMKSAVSKDGKSFRSDFECLYLPMEIEVKEDSVWTKGKDGTFRSSDKNIEGVKFKVTLTVKKDKTAQAKAVYVDGRKMTVDYQLKDDGKIHAVVTISLPNGVEGVAMKYQVSKAKPEKEAP